MTFHFAGPAFPMEIRITDLPDEVLVLIFTYLPACYLVTVSKTCERFSKLCCEKKIVKKLDFSKQYTCSALDLKIFFQPKLRCLNISELNLNHCYWLLAANLNFLGKLKNVRRLHLIDCHVTHTMLQQLMSKLKLDDLSWTWNWDSSLTQLQMEHHNPAFKKDLAQLQCLHIQVSNVFHLPCVLYLLQWCKGLRVLTLSESMPPDSPTVVLSLPETIRGSAAVRTHLPLLEHCQFLVKPYIVFQTESFIYTVVSSSFSGGTVDGFWTLAAGCYTINRLLEENHITLQSLKEVEQLSLDAWRGQVYTVLRNDTAAVYGDVARRVLSMPLPKCRKLSLDFQVLDEAVLKAVGQNCKGLEVLSLKSAHNRGDNTGLIKGLAHVAAMCTHLTTLNLTGTHVHLPGDENPCLPLTEMKQLKRLKLPACMVSRSNPHGIQAPNSQQRTKRLGNGVVRQSTVNETEMSRIKCVTSDCTLVSTFSLVGVASNEICYNRWNTVTSGQLSYISRWQDLQKLELKSLRSVLTGQFLVNICKQCTKLSRLLLKDIGHRGIFTYHGALTEALSHCPKLKDFRLEHAYDVKLGHVFPGLVCCTELERVCIISNYGQTTLPTPKVIADFVEALPNLIALYLVFPWTVEFCKKVTRLLNARFTKQRPAFNALIMSSEADLRKEFSRIPGCHLKEIVFP